MIWLRLALKDLIGNRRFSLLFILNLAIGLSGFVAIGSFGSSLKAYLENNLKEILTADLMVFSTRPLSESEVDLAESMIGPYSGRSEQVSFYSMVSGSEVTRLVQVIAIDRYYPLYGAFEYADSTVDHDEVMDGLLSGQNLLLSEDVASSLGIQPNETVRIGQAAYRAAYYFTRDPDKEVTTIELAPRMYMGINQLEPSGLIGFGSRVAYMRYYRFGADIDIAYVTDRLRQAMDDAAGGNSDIRVLNTQDVNRRLGRLSRHFIGYMGLVGVVALFMAGIASSYLFRSYLNVRIRETAILISLGAERYRCGILYLMQLTLLGLAASLVAVVLSYGILPFFPILLQGIIPANLTIRIDLGAIAIASFMGVTGSLFFCLPVYIRIFRVKPLLLLKQTLWDRKTGWKDKLLQGGSMVPALGLFLVLAILLTGSFKQGVVFTGGVFTVILLFALIGGIVFSLCGRLTYTGGVILRIAFRNLYRNRLSSISIYVTIATGAFLINLIPQVQTGLQEEIGQPQGLRMPVFFLLDIQEDQKQPLMKYFASSSHSLSNISPMVRGRIVSVNDVPFHERDAQKKRKQRGGFRRTEFNFSSREGLDPSESIIRGRPMSNEPWSFSSSQPFEISMAEHFGQRHQLGLGDQLVFDIQGIQLTGEVVNIRRVRWNSFQPNFFLQFQKGVLDDAPKTYLASVSQVEAGEKQALKNQLVLQFGNISVIDVTRTVEKITDIADKLSFSVRFMAYLAILAGLVAMFSIARNEAQKHEKEINLLKVLGAGFGTIRAITMFEFGFLGFTAALFAVLLSYGCSYGVSWFFFDRVWGFRWESGLLITFATSCVCVLTALLATEGVVRQKPVSLFE